MKNWEQILIAVAITLLAGVVLMSANKYFGLKEQEIINEAIYQCAVSSKYEVKDENGATVSYPVSELYQKCLEDKEIK